MSGNDVIRSTSPPANHGKNYPRTKLAIAQPPFLFSTFIHQIYAFLVYWVNNIRTGHVSHPCVIRPTGQIVREQQPRAVKLRNLLPFSSPPRDFSITPPSQCCVYERSPESTKEIRPFIKWFKIKMDEFEPNVIRKFKEGARPLAAPDDQSEVARRRSCSKTYNWA
jgi:hypothetical protein